MSGETTYKHIFNLSFPLMLGSAAQNVIALSDSVLLYFKSENDFAAIGFVGVFYLAIAAIGYGFSRGGQILIARRHGEKQYDKVATSFYTMLTFVLVLAIVMFLFMMYATPWLFAWLVKSPIIYEKSIEYLSTRAYGIFFAYTGIAVMALYTGISRTKFIIIDTIILAVVNLVLNYVLIFGKFGFPEMGIAGAGLASSIAEVIAVVVFFIYMIFDKKLQKYRLNRIPQVKMARIRKLFKISSPIVLQSAVGVGSWFVFFVLIEKMGEHQLAITNLGRLVYLILTIPVFGYSAGINTLVSQFIGRRKRMAILPICKRTAFMSLITMIIFSIPFIFFPKYTLYPILGSEDMSLFTAAQPVFYVIFIIMITFSIASVYFNGLLGTAATLFGLSIQFVITVIYLAICYIAIIHLQVPLTVAWALELTYWIPVGIISWWYLKSKRWQSLKI